MKIVVLGGSAYSTPVLWSYLASQIECGPLEILLAGRDRGRLEAVVRASRLIGKETSDRQLRHLLLDDMHSWKAFENADLIIVQIRNGGYPARSFDETFPLQYGVCGDEGLGPGGLSAALRNWPAIKPLLEKLKRFAPRALVLMLSSPVGLLVRAASATFPVLRIGGICELPWTTLRDACESVGVSATNASFDYFGVNHVGWFYGVHSEGRNVVQEYAALPKPETDFPSAELIGKVGGLPLKYMRLHYEPQSILHHQRQQAATRAQVLSEVSEAAFEAYRYGGCDQVEAALSMRHAPWYTYALGPLIVALTGRKMNMPFFLSFPDDHNDVLECAYRVTDGKLYRVPRRAPVPSHMQEVTDRLLRYEKVATNAVIHGDVWQVEAALRSHPWLDGVEGIDRMAQEIVSQFGRKGPS